MISQLLGVGRTRFIWKDSRGHGDPSREVWLGSDLGMATGLEPHVQGLQTHTHEDNTKPAPATFDGYNILFVLSTCRHTSTHIFTYIYTKMYIYSYAYIKYKYTYIYIYNAGTRIREHEYSFFIPTRKTYRVDNQTHTHTREYKLAPYRVFTRGHMSKMSH